MALVAARQFVPLSCFAALLDTIRNRTLNMALEINSEIGYPQDFGAITQTAKEQIERTIVNNIFGGTNYFASGHANITATTTNTQNIIQVGNRDQLDEALKNIGLSGDDLNDLSAAEKADGQKKMGARVMDWIKKNASKAVIGGVKLGADITKEVLVGYLKQYNGMS